jgi:hypothetical protein
LAENLFSFAYDIIEEPFINMRLKIHCHKESKNGGMANVRTFLIGFRVLFQRMHAHKTESKSPFKKNLLLVVPKMTHPVVLTKNHHLQRNLQDLLVHQKAQMKKKVTLKKPIFENQSHKVTLRKPIFKNQSLKKTLRKSILKNLSL